MAEVERFFFLIFAKQILKFKPMLCIYFKDYSKSSIIKILRGSSQADILKDL